MPEPFVSACTRRTARAADVAGTLDAGTAIVISPERLLPRPSVARDALPPLFPADDEDEDAEAADMCVAAPTTISGLIHSSCRVSSGEERDKE